MEKSLTIYNMLKITEKCEPHWKWKNSLKMGKITEKWEPHW